MAVHPSLREKYVAVLDRVLKPGARILLVGMNYDQVGSLRAVDPFFFPSLFLYIYRPTRTVLQVKKRYSVLSSWTKKNENVWRHKEKQKANKQRPSPTVRSRSGRAFDMAIRRSTISSPGVTHVVLSADTVWRLGSAEGVVLVAGSQTK